MKNIHSSFKWLIPILVLGLLLLTPLTSFAATKKVAQPVVTPKIACAGPGVETIHTSVASKSGRTVHFRVDWNCGPGALETFEISYEDGGYDTYTCYLRCTSGTTYFTHTYAFSGTYDVTTFESTPSSGNGDIGNYVTVSV